MRRSDLAVLRQAVLKLLGVGQIVYLKPARLCILTRRVIIQFVKLTMAIRAMVARLEAHHLASARLNIATTMAAATVVATIAMAIRCPYQRAHVA